MNKIDKTMLRKAYNRIKSFWTALKFKDIASEITAAINVLSDYDNGLRYIIYDVLFSAVRRNKDFDLACEMLELLDFEII